MTTKRLPSPTDEEKKLALHNAVESHNLRIQIVERRNSFSEWGNDKCISRLKDTIAAMKSGYASDRQYRYWLHH